MGSHTLPSQTSRGPIAGVRSVVESVVDSLDVTHATPVVGCLPVSGARRSASPPTYERTCADPMRLHTQGRSGYPVPAMTHETMHPHLLGRLARPTQAWARGKRRGDRGPSRGGAAHSTSAGRPIPQVSGTSAPSVTSTVSAAPLLRRLEPRAAAPRPRGPCHLPIGAPPSGRRHCDGSAAGGWHRQHRSAYWAARRSGRVKAGAPRKAPDAGAHSHDPLDAEMPAGARAR